MHLKERICKHNIVCYYYKTDLYFHDKKPSNRIDENGHYDRSIDHGIKRQRD